MNISYRTGGISVTTRKGIILPPGVSLKQEEINKVAQCIGAMT